MATKKTIHMLDDISEIEFDDSLDKHEADSFIQQEIEGHNKNTLTIPDNNQRVSGWS